MNWLSKCDMFSVKSVIIFVILSVACGCEGRKLYEGSQDDEDDSMDCSDGRKIDDPILLPFLKKLRGQEMLPAKMKEWVIYFDNNDASDMFDGWNQSYLTELGLSKEDQGVPYGSVYVKEGINVYLPRLMPIQDNWNEFRVMYAEQLLLDAIDKVKIYVKYDPQMGEMSKSSTRLLQVLLKRASPQTIAVLSLSCNDSCRPDTGNPLLTLASCGYVENKKYEILCEAPVETFPVDFFEGTEASHFERSITPEYQVELPVQLKQELHNISDWLLKRIGQRMRNYMEMAFKKNRFRKTNMELYNKVNLQINKIKGGRTFEAAKSADLMYNSLFDLNVYLNVTNTPYTFDKFHTFNLYLGYIGQFSKWQLDTTKYANFFEPLKELCLSQISAGNNLLKPATKIFELEDGVYDLTGVICHENILYVINGMTTINNIKSGLFDNENCDFDTVFVLAKKNLTINEDLKIPGKNLVIFAPTWIVFKEQVIDLSGRNGESDEEVESGQSGGDFYGFGVKFDRPDFLTFVTNGGDGGKGRDATAVVSDDRFTKEDGQKCVVRKDRVKEILAEHGATRGGLGGSAGAVSLKILRNPVQNYTVVRQDGKDGKDGKLHDITFQCKNNEQATLPVHTLTEINTPANDIQRMDETSILELFRKVIRKNSRRLSYDVLSFYNDIWTSPIIGETLDSTLNDFLNSSDYTESSKDFYEVTSQILHTQIKQTCNMTETQKTLVDFALATIRMTAPAENALPSVIDITSYLKEVSNSVGQKDIEDEYFERKDEKFRKIIEEANYYLKASLLPSLDQSIAETHRYLKDNADGYLVQGDLNEGRKFQENLVSNSLLRYLTEILKHVQLSLEDFVRREEYDPAFGTSDGQLDQEKLEKKLYFYRYLRNNVTVNEMNAMSEFIRLLKKMVDEESLTNEDSCQGCRRELGYLIKELKSTLRKSPEKCDKCLNALEGATKHHDKRSVGPDCDECDGDCTLCGGCDFCQEQCGSCTTCMACPWCPFCQERKREFCPDEYNCIECPHSPWCRAHPLRRVECEQGVDCTIAPYCPQCRDDNESCRKCNNCYRCPECPKCDYDECSTCLYCDECPKCPKCGDICDNCQSCHECPGCPICQDVCKYCQDCEKCPGCPQCRKVTRLQCDSCTNCQDCPHCPHCCESCTDCTLCPECLKCNHSIPLTACFACSDCSLCPGCPNCLRDICDTCADCRQCPECPMCSQRTDQCGYCSCDECPYCPRCRTRNFDEIDAGLFWTRSNIDKLSAMTRNLDTNNMGGLYKGNFDICDTCADCRQCPECPMCSQRTGGQKNSFRGGYDICEVCSCDKCPYCEKCGTRNFDEIDAGTLWNRNNIDKLSAMTRNLDTNNMGGLYKGNFDICDTCADCRQCPECPMCSQRTGGQKDSFRGGYDICEVCPCDKCPYCEKCGTRNFDEIDAGTLWNRNNIDKLSGKARNLDRNSMGGLYQRNFDICDTCADCRQCPECPMCSQRTDQCGYCSCDECPYCPRCRTRNFDEIDAGTLWNRNNIDKLSGKARNLDTNNMGGLYKDNFDICDTCADCRQCPECPMCSQRTGGQKNSFRGGYEICEVCSCDKCPYCEKCGTRNFDEIDAGLFWTRSNIDKLSAMTRNLDRGRMGRLYNGSLDTCDTCSDCLECPECPDCFIPRKRCFKKSLELPLSTAKIDSNELDDECEDEPEVPPQPDICQSCPCNECPGCCGHGFDEIESTLFWPEGHTKGLSQVAGSQKAGGQKDSFRGGYDICEVCPCDKCPYCEKCGTRNFDEIDAGTLWNRNNIDKLSGKARNLDRNSMGGLYQRNFDICDTCADCRQCPECPMCSQRTDQCGYCSCDECPYCPRCRTRNFDEIDAGTLWNRNNIDKLSTMTRKLDTNSMGGLYKDNFDICDTCADCRQCPECPMCSQRTGGQKNSFRGGYEICEVCPCDKCPYCEKCGTRNFDEIDAGLFWTRSNIDKLSGKARNLDRGSMGGLYQRNFDICDTCADCRQCPECPMCSQRTDQCGYCSCDECPYCPRCRTRNFDEIDAGTLWNRNNIDKLSRKVRNLKELRDFRGGYEICEVCSCDNCPQCEKCGTRNFDEIDAGTLWNRNNIDKLSGKTRNLDRGSMGRLYNGSLDTCDTCSDCLECPECPDCFIPRKRCFKKSLELPLSTAKIDSNELDDECEDEPEVPPQPDICQTCPCNECPGCCGHGFDEIESTLFWPEGHTKGLSQVAGSQKAGGQKKSFRGGYEICEVCPCDKCPYCEKCGTRNFDEIDAGTLWNRKNLKNARSFGLSNEENDSKRNESPRTRDSNANNLESNKFYKQSSFYGKNTNRNNFEDGDGSGCDLKNQDECLELPDSSDGICLDCIRNVENYVREVDSLMSGNGQHCDTEAEKVCKNTVNIVRSIIPGIGNPSGNGNGTGHDSLLLKCSDCNDTLDFFTDKLTAEISRCAQESNYNYREVDSRCSNGEGIIFHMKGCDPETFSRTFDDIRENFLKEFSQFVQVDQEHSHELDHIQSNFGYLLTNIDMLLQEGIPLSGATLNNVLYVTDALIKFKDLKMEYQKRMTELHDFSETDMYDLFSSELSMQNERLGMTSKWLNQLRKLLPWMKKVIQFLGANPKYQEVNERIREAIRLVSEIGPNVKLVERHRELRNYINRVKAIEKKEKTTGIGQAILDLKTSFKNTFIKDVFHKAVTMAQNWVFPLTKSFLAIQKIRGETYDAHLAAVSAEVEEYKKSIMLYTTLHSFDPTKNDVPFYEWNVRTRPTLLRDLFSGKPVILVSEILDGGKKNSLMAKDFEVRFVAGQRQTPGTQDEIDNALKGFWLNLTHSGISYFKFGSRIYRRLTETFTIRHTASIVDREKTKSVVDYVLSPYTTWVLRLEADSRGEFPAQIQDKIGSIELVGTGRYVINCADIPDVNQYFTPLNDYNRRNEK